MNIPTEYKRYDVFRRNLIQKTDPPPVPTIKIDIANLNYDPPTNNDLAVCFAFFNNTNSKRMLMNYLYVLNMMEQAGIPTFTIEVYSNKPKIPNSIKIKSDIVLFHKERLYHLLEKQIPPEYTKLLCMDADVVFDDPKWYDNLSTLLNVNNVVHPFKSCTWLDITFKGIVHTADSVLFDPTNRTRIKPTCHVGFAWAFQRDWFNKVGFYQYGILGGGDSMSLMSWMGMSGHKLASEINCQYQFAAYTEFIKKITTLPKMTYLDCNLYHLYHGSLKNRKYLNRHLLFQHIEDVRDVLKVSDSGLFDVIDIDIKRNIKIYFSGRDDDGV